jgi:hypothetical protein
VRRITSRLGGGGEALLLALLAAWSLIPLAAGVAHLAAHGGVLSGVDGGGVNDHFQYLAWVREASEHVLVSNRFDVAADPAIYLQPEWALGGLVAWITGSVQLGFLVFKPVAVAVLFLGFAAYVRRLVEGRWARLAALALALFYWPVAAPVMARLNLDTGRGLVELFGYEMAATNFTWGYFQTGIAVGLMPVFLLAVEGLIDPSRRRPGRGAGWYGAAAAAAGALVSWTHPWQGIVLLGVVAAALAWNRGRGLQASLAGPVLATVAPLVYFWALARSDSAWRTGAERGGSAHEWRWLALALLPLALAAIPGYLARRPLRRLGLQDRMLLLWPLVALAIYAAANRSFYYHFVSGLSLPLAVLAVRGWNLLVRRHGGVAARAAAVAAVLVCTVPGQLHVLDSFRGDVHGGGQPHYLDGGEAAALRYLDHSTRSGPVLARLYLGEAVPAFAGRRTYLGHGSWTPAFSTRVTETEALFGGRMPPARARELVRRSGAAFALSDCNERADLRPLLGAAVLRVRRFGCATVYELRE